MRAFGHLLAANENWLIDRVVHYAVSGGLTEHTSTMREAWRSSVAGLSGPIADALEIELRGGTSDAGATEARERLTAFGVEQALRHRARGLCLADFLALLKCCRHSYLDLIDETQPSETDRLKLRDHVLGFFDLMEIGLCREWVHDSKEEYLADLQDMNRLLANEKNKYLTIFESMQEPVILLDAAGVPVHLNDASQRIFYGEATPGASYYSALRSPLLESQLAAILPDRESDGDRGDVTIETVTGPREFKVKIQQMLDVSRKFGGTVIILNDVSNYKRALRQAESADRAKSTFLAAMSHELRTPIAGALGLARLLADTPLTPEQGHLVEGILSSTGLLSEVVGDILDFTRAEVGTKPLARVNFDLFGALEQIRLVVEPLAREKGLALDTRIAPGTPRHLRGDAPMIRQVLLNLIHNAIKFTDQGGVEVVVSRDDGDGDVPRIRFEVRDTGIGLPPGPPERLFDPFIQGDATTGRLNGGLGLGLAIGRRIVSRMGGEIGCHANEGGGVVFHFELPLETARDGAPASGTVNVAQRSRILLVDDDPVNRLVIEGCVRKLGHETSAAASAEDALRLLGTRRFDLVISDNRMPGMPGLELVRRIRTINSGANRRIPVIVSSASSDDLRLAGREDPAPDDFLPKPFAMSDLARVLARHLPAAKPGRPAVGKPAEGVNCEDDFRIARQHIETLGPAKGARVVRTYLETAPRLIEAIGRGTATGDAEAVSRAAHTLAGSSGILGLAAIEAAARRIEQSASASHATQDELAALRAKYEDAAAALGDLCRMIDEQARSRGAIQ